MSLAYSPADNTIFSFVMDFTMATSAHNLQVINTIVIVISIYMVYIDIDRRATYFTLFPPMLNAEGYPSCRLVCL